MRGLFLRHTQHNAHTMQRENKRHRSHISDGWWTKFSQCQCRKLVRSLRYAWENEYLFILLTRHFPITIFQQINKYIHTRNLTTSWPWSMVGNVAQGDGHSSVGRWSEGRIRVYKRGSYGSGDLSIQGGGKDLQRRIWCSSCGQSSWWGLRGLVHWCQWMRTWHSKQHENHDGSSWFGLKLKIKLPRAIDSYYRSYLKMICNLPTRPLHSSTIELFHGSFSFMATTVQLGSEFGIPLSGDANLVFQ